MSFEPALVRDILDRFQVSKGDLVLDPFCGAGTTLIECRLRGVNSIGLDANPVCAFASHVKTTWDVDATQVERLLPAILRKARHLFDHGAAYTTASYKYLRTSGMIKRRWISSHKAQRVVTLASAIQEVCTQPSIQGVFLLALASSTVRRIADIKFGPEVYVRSTPNRHRVDFSFIANVNAMLEDLRDVNHKDQTWPTSTVLLGDARMLGDRIREKVDCVITSPPYPSEHDYTRATRLELALLRFVSNMLDVRGIKQQMIRCHTKGVYSTDTDKSYCPNVPGVAAVVKSLEQKAYSRKDGFSRQYPKMVGHYFGGMAQHLRSVYSVMRRGARAAYVVQDQESLNGVYIDTPALITRIARHRSVGFDTEGMFEWRRVRGSTGRKLLRECVIMLRKP